MDESKHLQVPHGPPPRPSLDVPSSPTPTVVASDQASINAPPSPTLSHSSSVHFAPNTTLALRGNHPDANNQGLGSLGMLDPQGPQGHYPHGIRQSHRRGNSAGSSASTDSDLELQHFRSRSTESTTYSDKRKTRKTDSKDSNATAVAPSEHSGKGREVNTLPPDRAELSRDAENTDCGPFTFQPNELATVLDPKNYETLLSMGSTKGILESLGTDPVRGLCIGPPPSPLPRPTTESIHPKHSDLHVPGIFVTAPDDPESSASPVSALAPALPPTPSTSNSNPAYEASLETRRAIYGANHLPVRPPKSLLSLAWAALQDKVLILLSVAAVVALALGLFQDFGEPRPPGEAPVDWVEGVAIIVAIVIVVGVGSLNDWQKERQFSVLNEKKDERGVKVIRHGVEHVVDIKEVVVGDICLLEPGEVVPCDGIFLSGHNVKCDESSISGEGDAVRKVSARECGELKERYLAMCKAEGKDPKQVDESRLFPVGLEGVKGADCFVVSGSKVLEGVGKYVVIAVGTKSFHGRIIMAMRGDPSPTPLQLKLNALAELIAKLGSLSGLVLFVALFIRFIVQVATHNPARTASQAGLAFVNILIIAVTLIVVAVPEGLPLAVTLALAFATKRMTKERLLVRVLGSCETMGGVGVVCTDKTGTLTANEMTVVAGSIGIHAKFVRQLKYNSARTNAEEESIDMESPIPTAPVRKHPDDFSLDQTELGGCMSDALSKLLSNSVAINTTAFEDTDPAGEKIFIGSKTETALLKFARELGWGQWEDIRKAREDADVVQMIPFSSERKAMGVVVRMKGKNHGQPRWRLYLKGASEILTKNCVRHVVVDRDGMHSKGEVETDNISALDSDNISRTIIFYANQTLRTLALCYRDFDSWPPPGSDRSLDEVPYEDFASDLTLIGIVGIEDPLREGVQDAVAKCQRAGVAVKMCTGDNVLTARSIALQCGIFTAGGVIMEGPTFRSLSDHQLMEVVPRLQVLARSSPEDKQLLVNKLKELGETVAVTGDGTNDGPALKTADVGFSMGIAGTEVAKVASDIILMDDNFASIVKAIIWGRCVNDAVRKFLQFQVSTNVTAVVITLVSAIASTSESSVLSAVQLLWINIIMDTFAALALATDPASEAMLDRKPDGKTAPLFTVDMYKQILFQSTYQIIITLLFHFLGRQILGLPVGSNATIVQTFVFNAFVFAQIFNSMNCRRLDKKLNIFEGLTRNWYFIIITWIEIGVQILIVFVGGSAFHVARINGAQWGISLALGVVSIPLGAVVRLLPNGPFEKLFIKLRLLPNPDVLPVVRTNADWNSAITQVKDNLGTFSQVRGGRLRSSSFVVKSRNARLTNERKLPSSLMAMIPAIVASSVGGGWTPHPQGLSDPAHFDPSRSSAALWEGKIQVHPATRLDDPAYRLLGGAGMRSP